MVEIGETKNAEHNNNIKKEKEIASTLPIFHEESMQTNVPATTQITPPKKLLSQAATNNASGSARRQHQQQHSQGADARKKAPPGSQPSKSPPPPLPPPPQATRNLPPVKGNGSSFVHSNANNNNSEPAPMSPTSAAQRSYPAAVAMQRHDDDTSRAALAMAAVAAAATANHSSPAAAAKAARALAPEVAPEAARMLQTMPGATMTGSPNGNPNSNNNNSNQSPSATVPHPERKIRPLPKCVPVRLASVKTHLRQRLGHYSDSGGTTDLHSLVCRKLADGENDPFLQHLLLLQLFRGTEDEIPEETQSTSPDNNNTNDSSNITTEKELTDARAGAACDKIRSLLSLVEGAYDSLVALLPEVPEDSVAELEEDADLDDIESPVVIPDLLPSCTSVPGDPTVEFFKACLGGGGGGDRDEATSIEGLDEMTDLQPPRSPDAEVQEARNQSIHDSESPGQSKNSSPSVFSNMFSSVRRKSGTSPPRPRQVFGGVFRKKSGKQQKSGDDESMASTAASEIPESYTGEYVVQIDREMLGLTVENVLERTVVRTVLAGGAAKKAGAKVGSLIVKVGNVETKNLTHFETIDELRQSQRPLRLVLKQLSEDTLQSAREEMGHLIRGGGFGTIMNPNYGNVQDGGVPSDGSEPVLVDFDPKLDAYSRLLRRIWTAACADPSPKPKHDMITSAGEKLVWILTLLVIGLERESTRLLSLATANEAPDSSPMRTARNGYHHSAKDYSDAAKSIAKVLHDFVKKRIDPPTMQARLKAIPGPVMDPVPGAPGLRRPRRGPPPPPVGGPMGRGRGGRRQPMMPGVARGPMPPAESVIHDEKPLLQIGDVLHRTRSFLSDPTSPAAALLRGEVISFLCDVLDIDSDMELSEEEAVSSSAGGKGGPINDLGSAGSLLKLIVLNCSVMRSPGCVAATSRDISGELAQEEKRRFGLRKQFSGFDLHRLHAGNRFLAVVHRLAASRSTSARITACSLGPVLWGHLDFPHQLQLRGVITRALHDVDVIVRKSTATVLHEIAELVFDPRAVPWLVLMCERAMTDPEPQLRSAAMTLTWHLAEHLPNAFLGDASQGSRSLRRLPSRTDPIFADVYLLQCKLLPVATRLAEDRAPSVRLAVAAQCDRLCDALGDHWASVIIDVLLAFLSDSDERVRSEAVLCLPRLSETVLIASQHSNNSGVGVLESLLPATVKLQKDASAAVRCSLASAVGELLTLLVGLESQEDMTAAESEMDDIGRVSRYKHHVDDKLIPLVQKLLHDQDPEVTSAALRAVTNASRGTARDFRTRRHSIASEDDSISLSSFQSHASREKKDPVFVPVLSEEQVLRLLPTLAGLANSRQWRVRRSAVEIVPGLLGCTHRLETRAEIAQLCIRLMGDSVDAVRKAAAECLCVGIGRQEEDVSGEWMTAIVIPHLRVCSLKPDSKQRLLSLKMVELILLNGVCPNKRRVLPGDAGAERTECTPLRELLEISLSLCDDRIANVRLNVGRMLSNVIHAFDEDEIIFVKETLLAQIGKEETREGGKDNDVIYFATKCVERIQKRLDEVLLTPQEVSLTRCVV